MANVAAVHARIDAELKANAEAVLYDLGLTPTDAINVYYRQIVYNQGIPFKIEKPQYNKETIAAIEEACRIGNELKDGKRKGYTDMASLRRALEE